MKRVVILLIVVIILFCFCADAFAQNIQDKNLAGIIIANTIVGFGVGNIIQKNYLGCNFQAFAEISSYLSLIFYAIEGNHYPSYEEERELSGFLLYGLIMLGVSKTFGIIVPIVYGKQGMTPFTAMVLNTFLGFGFGSYFQEDRLSLAFLTIDSIFTIILATSFSKSIAWINEILLYMSVIGLSISRLFSLIVPFFFRNEQKAKNEDKPNENESNTDLVALPVFSIIPDGKIMIGFYLSF